MTENEKLRGLLRRAKYHLEIAYQDMPTIRDIESALKLAAPQPEQSELVKALREILNASDLERAQAVANRTLGRHWAGQPVAECTNEDAWNCKYCLKGETCAALKDERNFGAPVRAQYSDLVSDGGMDPRNRPGSCGCGDLCDQRGLASDEVTTTCRAVHGPTQTAPQPEQSTTVRVPISVIEEAAHMLEAHSPGSGSVESFVAQDLRAALSQPAEQPEVHLNPADKLPPVDCPLLIEVMKGYLVLAWRTGIIENKSADMEYRLVTGDTIQGRFRWTYP